MEEQGARAYQSHTFGHHLITSVVHQPLKRYTQNQMRQVWHIFDQLLMKMIQQIRHYPKTKDEKELMTKRERVYKRNLEVK